MGWIPDLVDILVYKLDKYNKYRREHDMEECNPDMLIRAYKIASERHPKGTQITTDIIDSIIRELKGKKDDNK